MSPKTTRRSGVLHPIRRDVLLLLGWQNYPLRAGIARYAREANWVLNDEYVRIGIPPAWWNGHGILGLFTNPKDVRALRSFPARPLVDLSKGWIAASMPPRLRIAGRGRPRVFYDNAQIARLGAEHFIERGFKHAAYMNCGNYWMDLERLPVFRDALLAAGARFIEIEYYKQLPRPVSGPLPDTPAVHRWLVKTVRDLPKPIGVMVTADDQALRLLRACDAAQVSVPEELAVLGCDNDPLICDYAPVPLSSVDNDWEGVGYAGAKLLDGLMNGQPPPREPLLVPPKGVVTRMSTSIVAVAEPKVARALRFIWEHYQEPIGALDVAAAAGLSRRALERALRKQIGGSVAGEILKRRLERAKKLLLETDLKAHEVAARSGFSGIVHFSQAFHRVLRIRPSRFRRQHRLAAS